jgi:hypothetical protein
MELPLGMGFSAGFVTSSGVAMELIQIAGMPVEITGTTSTLAFSVADLAASKEALMASGVAVGGEMDIGGISMFFIKDLDGRNIEIAQFTSGVFSAAEMHGHKNS